MDERQGAADDQGRKQDASRTLLVLDVATGCLPLSAHLGPACDGGTDELVGGLRCVHRASIWGRESGARGLRGRKTKEAA